MALATTDNKGRKMTFRRLASPLSEGEKSHSIIQIDPSPLFCEYEINTTPR